MFLLDGDVEESRLALLLHLLQEDVHRLMVDGHQGFNHDVVHQSDEVGQSFSVPIGDLEKIGLLLLLSAFEVHWFLLDLLAKLHLVLIFHVFEVALLVYFVLDLSHNNCHFVGNDAFVLGAGHFSGLVLLIVEVSLLPSLVIAYF